MLGEGRIPLNEAEHEAVNKLSDENPGESLTLTRRDPGESGPLLVHVAGSNYLIDDEGKRRKLKDD